jgi:hypothetical protein
MSAWDDFLKRVADERNELMENEGLPIWYRGQAKAEWELRPALLRMNDDKRKEKDLFRTFVRHASRVGPPRSNAWQTLFDMQHNFLPTRLLDWTETFGVALFFALQGDHKESAIWILHPQKLNEKHDPKLDVWTPTDLHLDYQDGYVGGDKNKREIPIAIQAPFQSDRMFAQRSVFTLHGESEKYEKWKDVVRKVPFSRDIAPQAREFLGYANINPFTVFPDVAGFARFMRRNIDLSDDPLSFV